MLNVRTYTLAEALETAQRPAPFDAAASRDERGGWHGEAWSTACEMALRGDPTAALKIKAVGAKARMHLSPRVKAVWAEAGSAVDVGRYLGGEPECMMETRRMRRMSPVIRLGIERCVPAFTSPDDMRVTGASVLACVEALRTAGIPSEVWATFTTQGNGQIVSERILIQESGRPVDVERLAFWAVNPAALRRIAFALYEQEPEEIRRAVGIVPHGGYGMPTPLDPDGFDEVAPATGREATAWIRDVLARRIGVEILDGWEDGR